MFGEKAQIAFVLTCLCLVSVPATADFNPFACRVVDISLNGSYFPSHRPAPGQFINHPHFKDPNFALGPPDAKMLESNIFAVVSLGRFGGQIVLAFENDVEDNAANPMGLDAIVFSNAFWVSLDPQCHWAELATIEIMPELNGNDTAGDDPNEKWYLIGGSHLTSNGSYRTVTWQRDDVNDYPAYTNWPDSYQTGADELDPNYQVRYGRDGVLVNPNYDDSDPNNDNQEGYWGYAEYTPTVGLGDRDGDNDYNSVGDDPNMDPNLFYTVPDDPMRVGLSAGSGGGDAFDIKWAVDPTTWQAANLASFRYIRITTAVDRYFPDPDEYIEGMRDISAEIDAVADVRPAGDIDGDSDVDLTDMELFVQAWLAEWPGQDFNAAADLAVDNKVGFADYAAFAWGWERYNGQQ